MAVNSLHPMYKKRSSQWELSRHAIEGDDAIKSETTKYVPKLSDQSNEAYSAMLNRAVYENKTGRTLDGVNGLIHAKPPTIETSDSLKELYKNIDLNGMTLNDLSQSVTNENLTTGRIGLLVDNTTSTTNNRPFIKKYPTESIINWKYDTIDGVTQLSLVVLKEEEETWTDEFTMDTETVYRVLSLIDNIYTVRIFKESDDKKSFSIAVDEEGELRQYTPTMFEKTMNFIPFVSITPKELTLTPPKPPLYDMGVVNISYFKLDVDLHQALHFVIPTPVLWGVQSTEMDDTGFAMGADKVKGFSNPSGRAEYLEIEGKAIDAVENKLTSKAEAMVVLGSNMLASDKKVAESENTVAMRNAGGNAVIISVADSSSRGIEKALQWLADWNGSNETIEYRLNTDYDLMKMDAQTIKALTESWQLGSFSDQEHFKNLQDGELISPTKTFDEHQTEIEEQKPLLSVPPQSVNNDSLYSDTLRKKLGLDTQ